MIISDQYEFIFIHIPKTGGMSIRRALAEQGIIQFKPSRLQRFMSALGLNKNYRTFRFRTHGNLQSVEPVMPKKLFEKYTKFTVVRNPWARLISEYEYFRQGSELHSNVLKRRRHAWAKNIKTFEEFVYRKADQENSRQYDYLKKQDGKLGVDIILKQESLTADFQQLCQHLGLKCELRRHNVTRAQNPFAHYYDSKLTDYVAGHWELDIQTFDYHFPLEVAQP